jgi:hypothetical protein
MFSPAVSLATPIVLNVHRLTQVFISHLKVLMQQRVDLKESPVK